jgi:hypothetical protein
MGFIISQIAIMALAAIPRDRWRSFSGAGKAEAGNGEDSGAQAQAV